MNKQSMEQSINRLEARLGKAAQNFPYPSTPDIANDVKQRLAANSRQLGLHSRRLAWTMMALALALVLLLAVPPVRATVFEMVRQGVVQVFLLEPLPTTTPLLLTITPVVSAEAPATASPSSMITPRPSATPISSVVGLTQKATPAAIQLQVKPPAPVLVMPNIDTTPPVKMIGSFY